MTVVDLCRQLPDGKIEVHCRKLAEKCTSFIKVFDYLVVGNGHYTIPNMPHYLGMEKVRRARLIHSRDIKDCRTVKDKSVFILGAGLSAEDIG